MIQLPNELYIYIISYLDERYEYYKLNRRCICYTPSSNYGKKCKKRTKNIFCYAHEFMPIEKILCAIQSKIVQKKSLVSCTL